MAAAQEAHGILDHLLSTLLEPASRLHPRYGPWIEKHGKSELKEALFNSLRPEVLTFLQLSSSESVTAMKNIGGNLNFEGKAVYLHGVLGMDRRTRVYIGQSSSLKSRVKQHWNFRYRRDNPSLHYHAVQNSIYDVFAVLAMLPHSNAPGSSDIPGMDHPELFLNVLETWCCLLFRCLPPQILTEYLPPDVTAQKDPDVGALNIANPLDHRGDSAWDSVDLSKSRDPLILEYVRETERKATPVIHYVEVDKPSPGIYIQPTTLLLIGVSVFASFMLLRRGPRGRLR